MKTFYFFIFLLFIARISYSQNSCSGTPTVDYAGKTYHTVSIGSQCWMKENLDAGVFLTADSNQTDNGIIEKYCYNNNLDNCLVYGALYQWDEAMQYSMNQGVQGICPLG